MGIGFWNRGQVSVFRQPELQKNALHVYLDKEEEDDGRNVEEEDDEDLNGDDGMEVR